MKRIDIIPLIREKGILYENLSELILDLIIRCDNLERDKIDIQPFIAIVHQISESRQSFSKTNSR